MTNKKLYISLAIVFGASIASSAFLPISDMVSGMIAVPGVAALMGALFQVGRDAAAFEKQRTLQTDQQVFAIGASSHMSTVAFDKQVEFCESYMSEVDETIGILFREGPTEEATNCAGRLFSLRRKYAAWIPRSVALELDPFEEAIMKIGAKTHLVEALRGEERAARDKAIDESYNVFTNVLGLKKMNEEAPDHREEIAVENVKERVRGILGINELFEIRSFIIHRSAEFIRKST